MSSNLTTLKTLFQMAADGAGTVLGATPSADRRIFRALRSLQLEIKETDRPADLRTAFLTALNEKGWPVRASGEPLVTGGEIKETTIDNIMAGGAAFDEMMNCFPLLWALHKSGYKFLPEFAVRDGLNGEEARKDLVSYIRSHVNELEEVAQRIVSEQRKPLPPRAS